MLEMTSLVVKGQSTPKILDDLEHLLPKTGLNPDIAFVFYNHQHDDRALSDFFAQQLPNTAIVGGTSNGGVMSSEGLSDPDAIGLLLLQDPDGNYGSAARPLGSDPAQAAEDALTAALVAADCPFELPELIWVYIAPGREERVLNGLRRVVGDRCPIFGGSAADDEVAGLWRQLGPHGPLADGVAVGVLFTSGGVGVAFQSGYAPTGITGIVTALEDRRDDDLSSNHRYIATIDDQPAAEVYNRWVDGAIGHVLDRGGVILTATSLCPLAVKAGTIDDTIYFRLLHPEMVTVDGGLKLFANVDVGSQLFAMRGDRTQLVRRIERVTAAASADMSPDPNIVGGLVTFCAGCRIGIQDRIAEVAAAAADSFNGKPFLGCFTFGEQGDVLNRTVHGNLMMSSIVFGH